MFVHDMKRNKQITTTTTSFGDFVLYLPVMTDESRTAALKQLNAAQCPDFLFSEKCPSDLNGLSFGQYSDICNAMKSGDHIAAMIEFCHVVFSIDDADIMGANVFDVFGFATMVCKEIERITKLFNSINVIHSAEEEQAGVKRLQFGVFGMLDWYARRMGITDHNEVNRVSWLRIYQCLKNDSEENAYQRRLQKVYNDKMKKK